MTVISNRQKLNPVQHIFSPMFCNIHIQGKQRSLAFEGFGCSEQGERERHAEFSWGGLMRD